MNVEHQVTLPGGFEVTLTYDGEAIHWRWHGPRPSSLPRKERLELQRAYLLARGQFLHDCASAIRASQGPAK